MTPAYCFYIVGVGGTGSLLARDLPRLIAGTVHHMILIDGDTVEKKNIERQSFQEFDIGLNKATAMVRKINSLFPACAEAVDKYITSRELHELIRRRSEIPVIIGCVDNDATRKLLEDAFSHQPAAVYIDSANSEYSGNVFVCIKNGRQKYGVIRSEAYDLADDKKPTDKSCMELIASGETQYFVTNARMAGCVLEHCFNLLNNEMKIAGVTKIDRFAEVHY